MISGSAKKLMPGNPSAAATIENAKTPGEPSKIMVGLLMAGHFPFTNLTTDLCKNFLD